MKLDKNLAKQIINFLSENNIYNVYIIDEFSNDTIRIVFDIPKNQKQKEKIITLSKKIIKEFVPVNTIVKIAICERID